MFQTLVYRFAMCYLTEFLHQPSETDAIIIFGLLIRKLMYKMVNYYRATNYFN